MLSSRPAEILSIRTFGAVSNALFFDRNPHYFDMVCGCLPDCTEAKGLESKKVEKSYFIETTEPLCMYQLLLCEL